MWQREERFFVVGMCFGYNFTPSNVGLVPTAVETINEKREEARVSPM